VTVVAVHKVTGPATHALVIGVGAYPSAQAGSGGPAVLQSVPNIQSAANSAMLFVDWLRKNHQSLTPPLATIEILIGEPGDDLRYPWQLNEQIEEPTVDNVRTAGSHWMNRCLERQGNVALLFVSGHGAIRGGDPIVFLTDLNKNKVDRWGAHLNVKETARAFKKFDTLHAAHFFVDACQEAIPNFQLSAPGIGARFTPDPDPFDLGSGTEKVTLLSASAPGKLAYEGEIESLPGIRTGRFTQTLLKALDGAAARDLTGSNEWVVHPVSIYEDLKSLYSLRSDWRDLTFDPTTPELPNITIPIRGFANPPKVPILVRTDPADYLKRVTLSIFDEGRNSPPFAQCPIGERTEWAAWLEASHSRHFIVAQLGSQALEKPFFPSRSIFNQVLKVQL
jgi:Caspase domain